jgi:hypothetical protein
MRATGVAGGSAAAATAAMHSSGSNSNLDATGMTVSGVLPSIAHDRRARFA